MGELNFQKLQEEHAEEESRLEEERKKRGKFQKIPYFKKKKGRNTLRFLPPSGDRDVFHKVSVVSFGVGSRSTRIIHPTDPNAENPMEEYLKELQASGSQADIDRAHNMRGKTQFLAMVIDRANEEVGPQVFAMTPRLWNSVRAIALDAEYGDISDPVTGCDIHFHYTPGNETANGFAETSVMPARNSSPLGQEEWATTDYFALGRVGEPTEPDYVRAVLADRVAEFVAEKKATRDAVATGNVPPPAAAASVPSAEQELINKQMQDLKGQMGGQNDSANLEEALK